MGIMSAVIATEADVSLTPDEYARGEEPSLTNRQTTTSVPIYLCAALYTVMAAVAAAFPFEPYGSRSS
jgi:hypothetical protein